MAESDRAVQVAIFQALKPACVRLSDDALKILAGKSNPNAVIPSAENLLRVLQAVLRDNPHISDRLVNYIFFPLSHLFKEREKFPIRALDVALQCLLLLLQSGWRDINDPNLGLQLLILLSILADPEQEAGAGQAAATTSSELRSTALKCFKELFSSIRASKSCKEVLAETPNLPAVGHAVTVILNGVRKPSSREAQISATQALEQFCTEIATPELLRNFLPGVFSTLSHVLVPSTKERRPYQVLERGLSVLAYMLDTILSDKQNSKSKALQKSSNGHTDQDGEGPAWLKATAGQTKLVLANVVKLRVHDRLSVRSALLKLCWVVLENCREALVDSISMILETTTALISRNNDAQSIRRLQDLMTKSKSISESIQTITYDASISLPRVIASNDNDNIENSLRLIATMLLILQDSRSSTSFIDETLRISLVECLSSIFHGPEHQFQSLPESFQNVSRVELAASEEEIDLSSALTVSKAAGASLKNIEPLMHVLARSSNSVDLARDALRQAFDGDSRVSNLWSCLSILQARALHQRETMPNSTMTLLPEQEAAVRSELYAVAVESLVQTDNYQDLDWRIQALSLEIVSFEARQQKQGFRPELVDVLYPVVHLLGAPVRTTRSLALRCLNTIATSCGYQDAKDLVVSNVDYLVNAVGMRLNALDISPQMPQVLLMMIKLCGPSLLPYLGDLIDGIYEALECYHGYPLLVEQLFAVLNATVEEGVKTSPFKKNSSAAPSHMKSTGHPRTIKGLLTQLETQKAAEDSRRQKESLEDNLELREQAPRKPWKELRQDKNQSHSTDAGDDTAAEDSDGEDAALDRLADSASTPTATYKMLETIAAQTQHHLPSSSSSVRMSLLSLLNRALPFLANHDDTFLPLIHTLWPVLVPRLEDKEAFVVAGVLEVMGQMFKGAGDFMSSRIDGLWPTVRKIHARCSRSADSTRVGGPETSKKLRNGGGDRSLLTTTTDLLLTSSAARDSPRADYAAALTVSGPNSTEDSSQKYVSTSTKTIRNALTNFLMELLLHVRISETVYSEILHEMLYDELVVQKRDEVRKALATLNSDAVWLVLQKAHEQSEASNARRDLSGMLDLSSPPDVENGPRFVKSLI